MTDISDHQLQGESVENLVTLKDLQILVKECAKTRYEARRFTQNGLLSQRYFVILNLY